MTKIKTNRNNTNNVPPLRFPEFSGEWTKYKVSKLLDFYSTNSLSWEQLEYDTNAIQNLHYGLIHVGLPTMVDLNQNKLPNIKEGSELKNYELCKEGDVAFADASEDTNEVAKAIEFFNLDGAEVVCGLHTIHGRDNNGLTVVGFKGYAFGSTAFHNQIRRIAQGTKIYSISTKNFSECYIGVPCKAEQTKIATLLRLIDARISTQNKIIEDLEQLKSAIRERLYTQIQEEDFEHKTIKDVLSYEHPTKYIVVDTEYTDDKKLTPVLTANKAFILGYTPEQENIYGKGDCIIFDDFTMDIKFVSFPFKIKSSAIKILTAKTNVNLYFIYEYLLFLNLISEEHKRHYISEIEPLHIVVPCLVIQHKIAEILQSIDKQIHNARQLQSAYQRQKQYLLNQMFI